MYTTFETLIEDTAECISKHLNLEQQVHLSTISTGINQLFHSSLQRCKKKAFFEHVKKANYPMVEKFLDKEPQLLFKYGELTENFPLRSITPLSYAFIFCDRYMLKLFKKNIEKKCTEENKKMITLLQDNPPEHVDLTHLFDIYEHYISCCRDWSAHRISESELNQAWLKLGKAQRKYFPWTMLKLYCSTDLKNTGIVSQEKLNDVPQVYDYYSGRRHKIALDITQLGEQFALYHTVQGVYAIGIKGSMTPPRNSAAIQSELTALRALFSQMKNSTDELLADIFNEVPQQCSLNFNKFA
ncbi:hypothetical protein FOLKNPGA_02688 [Legionella sp. PC1000]|uniref:hypothetical protein n=1 Tax=Legionella sp. PC1000 TaxID=2746060 RepID=UPI0015FC81E5|nr:hypothetical protein [Legionella sp. PC1000]QLZ69888.1 hypothetical protein FOLKNPGA_02688 [Legionella sp. PC1000]